jgi:hypothetical protein
VDEKIIAALPWICHPPKKRTKFDETFVKHHRLTVCLFRAENYHPNTFIHNTLIGKTWL